VHVRFAGTILCSGSLYALDHLLDESLDARFEENDPTNIYSLKTHNRFRYLNEGSDLRDEVLETIRIAETFVHLSYFELFPDRMGHTVAGLLIAKRLDVRTPCEIDACSARWACHVYSTATTVVTPPS